MPSVTCVPLAHSYQMTLLRFLLSHSVVLSNKMTPLSSFISDHCLVHSIQRAEGCITQRRALTPSLQGYVGPQ